MGGRGSTSGAKGGGASRSISFSPTRTTDISEKLNGKTLSLSRGTITIKGENGKTSGLVRIDRVSDMSPRDKFTRCYNVYHALGGNDVATELYRQVMSLPEKEDGQ